MFITKFSDKLTFIMKYYDYSFLSLVVVTVLLYAFIIYIIWKLLKFVLTGIDNIFFSRPPITDNIYMYMDNIHTYMKYNDNFILGLDLIHKNIPLEEKCMLLRHFVNSRSAVIESIIRKDLKINDNSKYKIITSIRHKSNKVILNNLRPDCDISHYIFVIYDMYGTGRYGKAFIYKVPLNVVNDMIVDYGEYSSNELNKINSITEDNITNNSFYDCEYKIKSTIKMNDKQQYVNNIITWLSKYEVKYDSKYF